MKRDWGGCGNDIAKITLAAFFGVLFVPECAGPVPACPPLRLKDQEPYRLT